MSDLEGDSDFFASSSSSDDELELVLNNIKVKNENYLGVIGAIDGSYIKIDKPAEDPDSYLNRKGYHSIQVQVVCDFNKKIRDVFIGYPGSAHDSRVFRNSPLGNSLQEKYRGNLTPRQANYNRKLAANRYKIEHCYGILKQKFRQLYHLNIRNIPLIVHFIRACCVLHNMALSDDFIFEENVVEDEIPEPENEEEFEEDDDVRRFRNGITMLLRMN
ncbi:hypothetical protein RN001_003627 [Aquatica leii]|uniref:DDE Tnp4 domain-containing protein n=1 Tax=Aquatica leii TaxID=1421715 RepID=A0AAN7SE51_9COLE|nr:hypothetical protein RN001_003627 [Aquatica leii]